MSIRYRWDGTRYQYLRLNRRPEPTVEIGARS